MRAFARRGAYCVAIGATAEVPGFKSRLAREKVVLPDCGQRGVLSEWLIGRKDLYGGLVIPTGDDVIAELHANRSTLAPHYRLVLPPGYACEVALDKDKLARVAADAGIPTPRFVGTEGLDGKALDDAAGMGFPVLVKPRYGIDFRRAFQKKVLVAENPARLAEVLGECRARSFDVLVQEMIPDGTGLAAYSAYVDREGEIAGDYSCRRVAVFPPRFGVGSFLKSERLKQVLESGRRLVRALNYRGAPIDLDFAFDVRDGVWKLLDFNARSWRQVSMAPLVGLDVFDMILADYSGCEVPRGRKTRWGCYWVYAKDALLARRGYPGESPRFREYLKALTSPHVFGLFDIADLRPWFWDLAPLVMRRFQRKRPQE